MSLKIAYQRLKKVIIPITLVFVACSGLLLGWSGTAQAYDKAGDIVENRAEREFDRVAGEGSMNQVKGKAQEGLGRVQRELGNEAEGTARQMRGKAQQGVGRAQKAADKASNAAEDQAEGLVDKVKDFFD